MTVTEIEERLKSYPGPHEHENWKLESDLNKCTPREKSEMAINGLSPEYLMSLGMNRGQVAHILFGYKHTRR